MSTVSQVSLPRTDSVTSAYFDFDHRDSGHQISTVTPYESQPLSFYSRDVLVCRGSLGNASELHLIWYAQYRYGILSGVDGMEFGATVSRANDS
jgi:hypothetical protein